MLVLSRKKGETIKIGDNINVTVIRLDSQTVKIGIDAPRDVRVHREEIYKLIEQQKSEAVL